MLNKKVTGKAVGMPMGILIGVLVSVAITLVCSAVLAWLIGAEKMRVDSVGYGAAVVLFLASFIGALTAVTRIKRLRTQVCLITGGIYYLVLLATTALFFGGQYQGMGVAAIFVIIGSELTALLGIREKKLRKSKFKKRAFC